MEGIKEEEEVEEVEEEAGAQFLKAFFFSMWILNNREA